jgi:hypothetical protein
VSALLAAQTVVTMPRTNIRNMQQVLIFIDWLADFSQDVRRKPSRARARGRMIVAKLDTPEVSHGRQAME